MTVNSMPSMRTIPPSGELCRERAWCDGVADHGHEAREWSSCVGEEAPVDNADIADIGHIGRGSDDGGVFEVRFSRLISAVWLRYGL